MQNDDEDNSLKDFLELSKKSNKEMDKILKDLNDRDRFFRKPYNKQKRKENNIYISLTILLIIVIALLLSYLESKWFNTLFEDIGIGALSIWIMDAIKNFQIKKRIKNNRKEYYKKFKIENI